MEVPCAIPVGGRTALVSLAHRSRLEREVISRCEDEKEQEDGSATAFC